MAYVAVNHSGEEYVYDRKPVLYGWDWYIPDYENSLDHEPNGFVKLPQGTIEKLIGKVLTWEDDPVEI